MGHAITMLTFEENMPKSKIQERCDDWGNGNCDLQERGYALRGLGYPINFTSWVFNSYEEAKKYLDTTIGNYRQTAVKYKVYPKTEPSNIILDLERRIKEYKNRIAELNKPHYANVKQATVKCKKCGSSLATSYCGRTYYNQCPICKEDLRPESTLQKIEQYNNTIKELEQKRVDEIKKQNVKNESKVTYRWMVCCEVHC